MSSMIPDSPSTAKCNLSCGEGDFENTRFIENYWTITPILLGITMNVNASKISLKHTFDQDTFGCNLFMQLIDDSAFYPQMSLHFLRNSWWKTITSCILFLINILTFKHGNISFKSEKRRISCHAQCMLPVRRYTTKTLLLTIHS